jgi:DNA-binding CsgD family transcriptional regulator
MAIGEGFAARAAGSESKPVELCAIDGGDGSPPRRRPAKKLSGKERAVLAGLARGHTTEQIADGLFVSPHTVRTHVKNGMRKLGARTRAQAVAIALSEGAIEAPRRPEAPLLAAKPAGSG